MLLSGHVPDVVVLDRAQHEVLRPVREHVDWAEHGSGAEGRKQLSDQVNEARIVVPDRLENLQLFPYFLPSKLILCSSVRVNLV